jgi:hypothetical protein
MWAVFKGSPPENPLALVEKFFYETRKNSMKDTRAMNSRRNGIFSDRTRSLI